MPRDDATDTEDSPALRETGRSEIDWDGLARLAEDYDGPFVRVPQRPWLSSIHQERSSAAALALAFGPDDFASRA